jgi:hypothetical protein
LVARASEGPAVGLVVGISVGGNTVVGSVVGRLPFLVGMEVGVADGGVVQYGINP